ncbi:hypothetical protein THRCLA_10277 [Thraustotheca clavata]|uniref:M96 mating-specific protein family n=1 Tax=Thraustotheca clavata TaxID=74557 RepID=A0A1V9YS48_9STRA|nr:hypothetical protein THRCLA_10277 [Thraustotheca clavata]
MAMVEDYIDFDIENMLDLSMFDPPLPDSASLIEVKSIPKKRKRLTIKHDILALRQKYNQLTTELELLKSKTPLTLTKSTWQERSIEQARLAKQAMQENTRLRELLNQHLQLSRGLERMYSKIQRINKLSYPGVEQFAVLGITKRHESLRGILQHQYNLLSSHWIRHDLYRYENSDENIAKSQLHTLCAEPFIDYVKCTSYSKSVADISNIIWDMLDFCLEDNPKAFEVIDKDTECFQDDILYSRYICHNKDSSLPPYEARLAMRRFIEKDRVVIIWHTITDDTLYPWNPKYWRNNASGWMIIQSQGKNKSRIMSYIHMAAPTITTEPQGFDICALMTNMLKQFEQDMNLCDEVITKRIAQC